MKRALPRLPVAVAVVVALVASLSACGGGKVADGQGSRVPPAGSVATGPSDVSASSAATAAEGTPDRGGASPAAASALSPATGQSSARRASSASSAVADLAPAASGVAGTAPAGGTVPGTAPPPATAPAATGQRAPNPGTAGAGVTTGVTPTEILFGVHLPQSGPTGILLGNGWKGIDAYFRSINDAGGINGRRLRLVVADDKYSAQGAAGAIRELVDTRKVFAVGCPIGADQCSVSVDYANSKGVPFISGGFREEYLQDKPWAFPVTASYAFGGARLLDYLFQRRGYTPARKIGFFYLHSENFDEMVRRADDELARLGSRFAVKYPAEKDQSDFSAAVTKMQSAGVDTVWFHTAPDLTTKFAAQAKLLGFHPQYVFTLPAGGDLYAAAAGGNLDKAFGLAGFDDPDWPEVGGFRDLFHRYYPNDRVDEFTILCYIVGSAFVEGVRRAGPDLDRADLARGLGSIDRLDTGISQPVSYTGRGRVAGPDSTFAVWEIHGTATVQTTGFDW